MSDEHKRLHFSATCHTADLAVLHCLRALVQFAVTGKTTSASIGWGGTGESEWRSAGEKVTFRFPDPESRQVFQTEANRLLAGHWELVATSDADPAKPQR